MTAPRNLPPAELLHLVDRAARTALLPEEVVLLRNGLRRLAASEVRARAEVDALHARVAELADQVAAGIPQSRLSRHTHEPKAGATPDDARRIAARLEAGMNPPRTREN